MIPTDIYQHMHQLPEGSRSTVFAKDQPQYIPLPAMVTPDGGVITSWLPDQEELRRLNRGEPITLIQQTFRSPLQPVMLVVGVVDAR